MIVGVVVIVENRTFELMRELSDVIEAEDRSRAGAELNQSLEYRLMVGSGPKWMTIGFLEVANSLEAEAGEATTGW